MSESTIYFATVIIQKNRFKKLYSPIPDVEGEKAWCYSKFTIEELFFLQIFS